MESHRDPEPGEQVEGDSYQDGLPVQEAPDPGDRYGSDEREHGHAGEHCYRDSVQRRACEWFDFGKWCLAPGRRRLGHLVWRDGDVGSGGHHGSSLARRAGRKSDRITEVMGRREYAYVTVAYGTVGFPGTLEGCSTEFSPYTCGVHCT